MIFNFTEKYQFGTSFSIDGQPIDVIDSTQLLGTTITSDLRWDGKDCKKSKCKDGDTEKSS